MMKKIVLLTLILFVASCSFKATKKEPEQVVQGKSIAAAKEEKKKRIAAEKKEKQKSALKKVGDEARPIIDNILQSIKDINYETYIKDFDSTMKSAYHDKEQFKRINKGRKEKYGEPGARPLVRIRKDLQYYILTYLVKFSKVEKPIPVIMTLKREEGKLKVAFLQYKFSILKK
jgi:hypothetical protein